MSSLSSLKSAQISAIATALAGTSPTQTPTATTDGATLYSTYCASCHVQLSSSQVLRSSVSKITSAINEESEVAGLKSLTSTQTQAIAYALSGGTAWVPSGGSQSVMYAMMDIDVSRPLRVPRYPSA